MEEKKIGQKLLDILTIILVVLLMLYIAIFIHKATDIEYLQPTYEETYTYGSFDELLLLRYYTLSSGQTLSQVPKDNQERNGQVYEFISLKEEGDEVVAIYKAK